MPISLCMITKNEEEFLENSIKSAKGCVNDIVVADTGSTDKTKEIALRNGARVYDFKWCDDFSAARNFAASHAVNDWIFVLDADEIVKDFNEKGIAEFIKNPLNRGIAILINNPGKEISRVTRLYNRANYMFEGAVHEQLLPIIKRDYSKNTFEVPILLEHYGYSPELMASKMKLERNEKLLLRELEKQPDDPYLLFQLGKVYFYMSNNLEKACYYFEKAIAQSPEIRFEYVYDLVECYGYALINTGQYEKGLMFIRDYSKHYNDKANFRFLMAHAYMNNGMLIEAVECFESCIVSDAKDYRGITSFLSYYNIGIILECCGMKNDAKLMYEKCGDYEPALERLAEI